MSIHEDKAWLTRLPSLSDDIYTWRIVTMIYQWTVLTFVFFPPTPFHLIDNLLPTTSYHNHNTSTPCPKSQLSRYGETKPSHTPTPSLTLIRLPPLPRPHLSLPPSPNSRRNQSRRRAQNRLFPRPSLPVEVVEGPLESPGLRKKS